MKDSDVQKIHNIIREITHKLERLNISEKYENALNAYLQEGFIHSRCRNYADEIIEGIREVVKYAFNNGGDKKAFGNARKTIKNCCKAVMKLTTVNPKALSQSDEVYERVARKINQHKEKVDKTATGGLKQRLNNTIEGIAAAEKFGLISTNVLQEEFVSADGSVNPKKLESIVEDGTWESIYDLSSKTAEDHFNKILRKINFIRDCIVCGKDTLREKREGLNKEIENICAAIRNWSKLGEIVRVREEIKNTERDALDLLIEVIRSEVLEAIEIIRLETAKLSDGAIKNLYSNLIKYFDDYCKGNFYYLHYLIEGGEDGLDREAHMMIIRSPATIGDTELKKLEELVVKIRNIEEVKKKIKKKINKIRINVNTEQV